LEGDYHSFYGGFQLEEHKMGGKIRNWLVGYLDNDVMRENAMFSIADGMTYSIMNGLTMSFMGVFALRLGLPIKC
jgi:hypothetical protein